MHLANFFETLHSEVYNLTLHAGHLRQNGAFDGFCEFQHLFVDNFACLHELWIVIAVKEFDGNGRTGFGIREGMMVFVRL